MTPVEYRSHAIWKVNNIIFLSVPLSEVSPRSHFY
jgi:hypothetical protein